MRDRFHPMTLQVPQLVAERPLRKPGNQEGRKERVGLKPNIPSLLSPLFSWFPGFLSGPSVLRELPLVVAACLVVWPMLGQVDALDCNRNGVEDVDDLTAATSEDCNADGVPDECELVPFDFGFRQETFVLGDGPRFTVVADFNSDGLDDLVSGNQAPDLSATVSVLLASAGGTFEPSADYDAGTRLSSVHVADLDADGMLDLVTAHSTELLLFRGTDDGTFAAPLSLAVPKFTRWATAVDLTADGLPELVTTNTTDDTLRVHLNRGALDFASPATYFVDERPAAVTWMDLDGDTDLDLVAAHGDSRTLLPLINSGDGRLRRGTSLELEAKPIDLWQGDLDGDGAADGVVSFPTGIALVFNPGDGTLPLPVPIEVPTRDIDLGDFDGDADLDLAVAAASSRGMTLFANRGDGDFVDVRNGAHSVRLVDAGDFDGDGDLDLALTNEEPDRVNVLWNAEPGAIPLDITTYPTGGHSHALAVADYDGDGDIDVATVDGGDRSVSLLFNDGVGVFSFPVIYNDVDAQHLHHVIAADLDSDGDADLVAVGRGTARVWVLINQGDGTFGDFGFYPVGVGPWLVAAADLDQDGDLDLASANSSSNNVTLLFNTGAGRFTGGTHLDVGAGPLGLAAADFDTDGAIDLVVAETNASTISVRRGHGDGTFAAGVATPVTTPPGFVIAADLDADGAPDVVTANRGTMFDPRQDGPGDLGVFLNAGGQLQQERSFPVGHVPWSVIPVDLDRDGRLDLVSSSQQGDNASFLVGAGDGTFAEPIVYNVGDSPRFILAADLDADGNTDLVTSDRLSRTITVLLNRAGATFYEGDYLTTVCTALDFYKVSFRTPVGQLADRVAQYILPLGDDPSLIPPLFPNVSRFPRLVEMLSTVFPERFAGKGPAEIESLWERRTTREYYAGGVRRLHLEADSDIGGTVYGFDVATDAAPDELLTQDEVLVAFERLGERFDLKPLVYAPQTAAARERAATWGDAGVPVVLTAAEPEPEPPPAVGMPTFELEIAADTEFCGVFAEAGTGRGLREEYEFKTRVRLRVGVFSLPTDRETVSAELFEEVLFGPERERAEPDGTGEFRLVRVPGEVAIYRFTYAQLFTLSDGRRLEMAIVAPLIYQARGDEPLEVRRQLGPEFFVSLAGLEPMQATIDSRPLMRFGSCNYESLSPWRVAAVLEDGVGISLKERYDEAKSAFETAPAMLTRAQIRFADETRVVTDYFELVYSARRHNTAVEYQVLFDPPVTLGEEVIGGVELHAPEPPDRPFAEAAYLGAELNLLRSVGVSEFTRAEAPEATFIRGDATADGAVNLVDVLAILDHIFSRGVRLPCLKAADANDDGRRNLLDPIVIVAHLFGRGEPLPGPFPECGSDVGTDGLNCEDHLACE
jgi:energy-coupling factor transporter ATP-binding protein EcfA2